MLSNGQLSFATPAPEGVICFGGKERCSSGVSTCWLHCRPSILELELCSRAIPGKLEIEFPFPWVEQSAWVGRQQGGPAMSWLQGKRGSSCCADCRIVERALERQGTQQAVKGREISVFLPRNSTAPHQIEAAIPPTASERDISS